MWSRELADGAQNWADQLASTDSLQHDEVAIHNRKMGKFMKWLSCTYLVDWYRKRLIPISKGRIREFFETESYPRSLLDVRAPFPYFHSGYRNKFIQLSIILQG